MAAMATTTAAAATGMARLLTPSTSAAAPRPVSSFSPFSPASRHLGSLHVAFARNVPAERKSVAVTPAEPEMSPADLKAYEEACAKLEGTTPDFWEGDSWNLLGFIIQYMWVFGVAVSIIACLVAVRTYNLGATDFKNTEVFKEAIEYQVDGGESSPFEESSNQEAP